MVPEAVAGSRKGPGVDVQVPAGARIWRASFAIGMALALSGCGPCWIWNDSWNQEEMTTGDPEPEMRPATPENEIAEVEWWAVTGAQQAEAQGRLSEKVLVAITEDEAKVLVGEVPGDPNEGTPYLVRAVYLWGGPGFRVDYAKGELHVRHTSMGAFAISWRPHRHALVIRLKTPPKRVVVGCGCMV